MSSFSWDPAYHIDVESIDRQHRRIFDYMAGINGLLSDKAAHGDIDGMLDQFDIYCKMHFYEEERLMEEMDFPSIADHKRQHDQFVLNLDRFRSTTDVGSTDAVHDFENIKNWFVNHILT